MSTAEDENEMRHRLSNSIFVSPSRLRAIGEDKRYDIVLTDELSALDPVATSQFIEKTLIDAFAKALIGDGRDD
jgi:hypothetical protein